MNEDLPSVAGRMEMRHADFQHACQMELGRLQRQANYDATLFYLLCEAIRCSRECCELAQNGVPRDKSAAPMLLQAQDKLINLWLRGETNEAKLLLKAFKIGRDSVDGVPRDVARKIAEALQMAKRNLHWVVLDDEKVLDPIGTALSIAREHGLIGKEGA